MHKITDRPQRKWFIRGLDLMTYKKICGLVDKGHTKPEIERLLQLPDRSVCSDAIYLYEEFKKGRAATAS